MESLLKVENLKLKALPNIKELSFEVNKSEILGIFGQVDCGYDEIINAICGLSKIKSGSISLTENFYAIHHDSTIYEDLTVLENIEFTSEIYSSSVDIDEILKTTELTKYKNTVVNKLPLALRKLAQLACVMSTDFDLLIIEEPSMALDDASNMKIIEIAKSLKVQNKGILIFTSRSRDLSYCDKTIYLEAQEVSE